MFYCWDVQGIYGNRRIVGNDHLSNFFRYIISGRALDTASDFVVRLILTARELFIIILTIYLIDKKKALLSIEIYFSQKTFMNVLILPFTRGMLPDDKMI